MNRMSSTTAKKGTKEEYQLGLEQLYNKRDRDGP